MRFALLDDENARRGPLRRSLSERGVIVRMDDVLARAVELAGEVDALIVIGDLEQIKRCTGALAQSGSRTPLILVTRQGTLGDLVAMIHGAVYGMVTFAEGLDALVALLRNVERDIQQTDLRVSTADAARRGLALLRRTGASGLLHVDAQTGGGQVLLCEGRVLDAECGALRGEDAAAALVAGLRGEVALRWESLDASAATRALHGATGSPVTEILDAQGTPLHELPEAARAALGPPRVLFADDDEALRTLFARTLEHQGFAVTTVADGRSALERALAERPDAILSDVMMPRLDGWGLLAAVRADHRLRETPLALLSCHHELLDQLASLGAGADAYLPKGARRDQVAEAMAALVRPAQLLAAHLAPGVSLKGHLGRLGPQTLMRLLATRNATGLLVVEDRWARFELWFAAGLLASASARIGEHTVADKVALRSLIGAQGGCWTFEAGREPELWSMRKPAVEVIEEIARRATDEKAMVRDNLITGTQALIPNEPVLRFYETVCPTALQPVLDRVRAGAHPRQIMAEGLASPLLVDWLFKDMLTKGAVRFAETS